MTIYELMTKPLILELYIHSVVQEWNLNALHVTVLQNSRYINTTFGILSITWCCISYTYNIWCQWINTHKNCAGVYWNINVSGWKLLGWLDDMEGMVEGKTEVLVRKQLIFDHCAFFCMSLYAPLYVTKTVHCVIQFQVPLNKLAALRAVID